MTSGLPDELEPLLLAVAESSGPIGTREAGRILARTGLEWSESTISRRLRELDERGLTEPLERKGRVLTASGKSLVNSLARTSEHADLVQRASRVDGIDDLLDLLRARRAVEPEATREAVQRIAADDIEVLRDLISQHDDELTAGRPIPRQIALTFHRRLASLARNPLLQSALRVVLDPALDRHEAALDVVLESHHAARHTVEEHTRILNAILDGDARLAERLMRDHLDRLVSEVEESIANGNRLRLNRVLGLVGTNALSSDSRES